MATFFLYKEGRYLIIRRLSFSSNTNFLFSLISTLKLSNDGEWLQSNKQSLTVLPIGLTFFLVSGEILICSPILTLKGVWHIYFCTQYAIMTLFVVRAIANDVLKFRKVIEFESLCIVICFSYIYLMIDRIKSFIN